MANLLDGSQRERSPKHGKAAEKSLLPLTEQVMTPVDGCGESLLARDPAATSREEAKAVGEALENLSGSEIDVWSGQRQVRWRAGCHQGDGRSRRQFPRLRCPSR